MKRMEVLTLAAAALAVCVEVRNRLRAWKRRKALDPAPIRPADEVK